MSPRRGLVALLSLVTFASRSALAEAVPKEAEAPNTSVAEAGSSLAAGESSASNRSSWETAPAERRSGLTVGFTLGGLLGKAAGFPNDAKKIMRASAYTETGVAPGGGATLWVGAALADWLVFGLGGEGTRFSASGANVVNLALDFHVDVFPLYAMGGAYRDVGLAIDTGTGITTGTSTADDSVKLIDGGSVSRIGLGGFFEAWRAGPVTIGPSLSGDYAWSASSRRGTFMLGLRTTFSSRP